MEGGPNNGGDYLSEGKRMDAIMFSIEIEDEDDARLLGVTRNPGENSTAFHRRICALKDRAGVDLAKRLGLITEGMSEDESDWALYEYATDMAAKEHGVSKQEFEDNDELEPDFEPWRYLRRKQLNGEL